MTAVSRVPHRRSAGNHSQIVITPCAFPMRKCVKSVKKNKRNKTVRIQYRYTAPDEFRYKLM